MILALDSSAAISVAVLDPTPEQPTVLASRHRYDPRKHAELLSEFITEALAEAGVGTNAISDAISAVVVGQGPGPFTGLRVALVTARVLAHTLGVPVHGLPSLDGLALAARQHGLTGEVIAATDARRREVYWARYDLDDGVRRLTEPAVGSAAELVVDGAHCVGRGCELYPDALPAALDLAAHPELLDPCATRLGELGARYLRAGGEPVDPSPLYLRRPDATLPPTAAQP